MARPDALDLVGGAGPRPLLRVWLRRRVIGTLIGFEFLLAGAAALVMNTGAGAAAAAGLYLYGAAAAAWFLRYPLGVYDPATNTYLRVWPFGLAWRRYPSPRGGRALVVRGGRIVDAARPWRAVVRRSDVDDTDWQVLARQVRDHQGRAAPAAACSSGPGPRPDFITRRHRLAGLGLVLVAVICTAVVLNDLARRDDPMPAGHVIETPTGATAAGCREGSADVAAPTPGPAAVAGRWR